MVLLRVCVCSCVFSLCKSFWIICLIVLLLNTFLFWFINSTVCLILFSLLPWVLSHAYATFYLFYLLWLTLSITWWGFCRSHARIISLSTYWLLCGMAESVYKPSSNTWQLKPLYSNIWYCPISDFCHFENC